MYEFSPYKYEQGLPVHIIQIQTSSTQMKFCQVHWLICCEVCRSYLFWNNVVPLIKRNDLKLFLFESTKWTSETQENRRQRKLRPPSYNRIFHQANHIPFVYLLCMTSSSLQRKEATYCHLPTLSEQLLWQNYGLIVVFIMQ